MNDSNKGRVGLERQLASDSIARAMARKFTPPAPQSRIGMNTREVGGQENRFGMVVPDQMTLNTITRATTTNIEDNKNILELFPELRRVMQIYVAALSNPTDLKTIEIFVESEDFPARTAEIVGPMNDLVLSTVKNVYNIKKLIPRSLEEILFTKGSWNAIVLPESTIDRAINGNKELTLESFGMKNGQFESWGLLGNDSAHRVKHGKAATVSFEDYFSDSPTDTYDPNVRLEPIRFINTLDRDGDGKPKSHEIPIPDMVSFVDNPDILRMPDVMKKASAAKVQRALQRHTLTFQSADQPADPASNVDRNQLNQKQVNEIYNSLHTNRSYKHDPVYALATPDTLSRGTLGHPAVMHAPAEALIPIHAPGDPENHQGYLLQIDEFGHPVRLAEDSSYYRQLEGRLSQITADIAGGSSMSMATEMIGAAKNMVQGTSCSDVDLSAFVTSYEALMQRSFIERMTNGYFASAVEIGASSQFYLSMLARTLAHKQTRVLFIPRELVTYIAFDYNKYGIGRSMLEATKMISSQRAMLMVQELMAKIKSSINYTTLSVTLEEDDRDPVDTIEQALHSFARVYQSGFPLGETNPMDIVNAYERNSIKLKVDGNNPAFPKLGTDVSVDQRNYVGPADDLAERLRRDHYMAFGLSPEVVDTSYQSEFAASVITANAMQDKQFTTLRDEYTDGLTDHVRKYMAYSSIVQTSLRNIVRSNIDKLTTPMLKQLFGSDMENGIVRNTNQYQNVYDASGNLDLDTSKPEVVDMIADAYVGRYLGSIQVKLPEGNARRLSEQKQEYDGYKEAMGSRIDDFLSPDYILTLEGVDEQMLQSIKASLLGYAMRAWCTENNFLPEASDFFDLDDKKRPILDWKEASKQHIQNMATTMGDFAAYIKQASEKTSEKLGAWSSDSPAEGGGMDTSTDSFGGGEDDFGASDDSSLDFGTSEETTEEDQPDDTTEDTDEVTEEETAEDANPSEDDAAL